MGVADCAVLERLLALPDPALAPLRGRLAALLETAPSSGGDGLDALIALYHEALPPIEAALWRDGIDAQGVHHYQALFRELEGHIARQDVSDDRHAFVVVIPVADRPQQLGDCLESLLALCRDFGYGGREGGRYRKLSVLIADDSAEAESIARHRALADHYSRQGLATQHLDQTEQRALVAGLAPEERARLRGVVGAVPGDGEPFHHKGASLTRNIAYLKLRELAAAGGRQLFWFVDSDQEFRVNVETAQGERALTVVNYLYHLDRIFDTTGARIFTGKVVGDPPVAPAVMAGTFLDDVNAFLATLAGLAPDGACTFHAAAAPTGHDAAYHDMADLFGFTHAAAPYRYRCGCEGEHDHARCFADFAARLERFFDGEHPTRRSLYRPEPLAATVQPARTIYTGNYLLTSGALDYFIPFAPLRLRMAGPALGRIIRAEAGNCFLSANLPMLHRRTAAQSGRSEFRPGVERGQGGARVDLSGEFERQYFGDVMLFTLEGLEAGGEVTSGQDEAVIAAAVAATEERLHARYRLKRGETAERLARARALFDDPARWWWGRAGLEPAREAFRRFLENMERNFGADSRAYRLIDSDSHRQARRDEIAQAIGRYREERALWRRLLFPQGSDS